MVQNAITLAGRASRPASGSAAPASGGGGGGGSALPAPRGAGDVSRRRGRPFCGGARRRPRNRPAGSRAEWSAAAHAARCGVGDSGGPCPDAAGAAATWGAPRRRTAAHSERNGVGGAQLFRGHGGAVSSVDAGLQTLPSKGTSQQSVATGGGGIGAGGGVCGGGGSPHHALAPLVASGGLYLSHATRRDAKPRINSGALIADNLWRALSITRQRPPGVGVRGGVGGATAGRIVAAVSRC
ncbi:uncharacterized PE-PGRS family protein PE_PGRS54-like [Schistocerca americana]|uniref:uncharacterized PE-PGRS family protein PE_PGRS54-like n=1 Tax=Schistocerca americana TaxID=7009 RepID=UPI001F4F5855|nr:uncharacterized PE-PGRS family protein PE_PGRS54-like [Schistocerca americana]